MAIFFIVIIAEQNYVIIRFTFSGQTETSPFCLIQTKSELVVTPYRLSY